jgi:hypothetical protein
LVHSFGTRSPWHRTPRLHRCCGALAPARPSVEHDAPDLPLLSAPPCACAAVPVRHSNGDQHVSWSHARNSGCTANSTFPPTQPDLPRGVAGQTSHSGDEGGAFPCGARQCAVVPAGVPGGTGGERALCIRNLVLSVSRRKTRLNPFKLRDRKSMCAARGDAAQRCRGGAGRGRQGEEPRRVVCRHSAYRQGALPPTRTVGCAGMPPRSPGVLRTRE